MKLWRMLQRRLKRFAPNVEHVVVDTNILISGTVARQGFPAQLIDAAIAGRIQFVVSANLIDEYVEVIQRPHITKRYRQIGDRVDTVLFYLNTNAQLVKEIRIQPVITDDPDDDFLLACALAGQAKYIISGDEHLLKLKQYRGVRILTPRMFVEDVLA